MLCYVALSCVPLCHCCVVSVELPYVVLHCDPLHCVPLCCIALCSVALLTSSAFLVFRLC